MSDVCRTGWDIRRLTLALRPGDTFEATPEACAEYEELRREHDPVGVWMDEELPRLLAEKLL